MMPGRFIAIRRFSIIQPFL